MTPWVAQRQRRTLRAIEAFADPQQDRGADLAAEER
jgi:hypothetical protein